MITRKTLVREVVARGRDPRTTTLREIAEPPNATIDRDMPLGGGVRASSRSSDFERVPVVEDGKLVGVLSRSRRAAAAGRGRAAAAPRRPRLTHLGQVTRPQKGVDFRPRRPDHGMCTCPIEKTAAGRRSATWRGVGLPAAEDRAGMRRRHGRRRSSACSGDSDHLGAQLPAPLRPAPRLRCKALRRGHVRFPCRQRRRVAITATPARSFSR